MTIKQAKALRFGNKVHIRGTTYIVSKINPRGIRILADCGFTMSLPFRELDAFERGWPRKASRKRAK